MFKTLLKNPALLHKSKSRSHTTKMTSPNFLTESYTRLRATISARDTSTPLPSPHALQAGRSSLPSQLPATGLGPEATHNHLLNDIVPALSNQSLSSTYFGFITGGVLPIAEAADNIVTALDQNVQVHLPESSLSTEVEDAALRMLIDLLELGSSEDWPSRTVTTGATASNILGLACAREGVIDLRLSEDRAGSTVAKAGLLRACAAAGVREIQILTSMAHSSVSKAASVVGLGHDCVKECAVSEDEPWRLDLDKVERELKRSEEGVASIIAISAGEVNTGRFATNALDMPKLRSLADKYGAWIHVDGAFGVFARALPQDEDRFLDLRAHTAGLDLADSITVDGHKLLNVPYDTGMFFCRHKSIPATAMSNPNAAYLSATPSSIQSPLNIGLENSRRFRALPVYAALLSEGKTGFGEILASMVALARDIATYFKNSPEYEWLPDESAPIESVFMGVLFRAKDKKINDVLVQKLNSSGRLYVSGTSWKGEKAVRIAVSNWRSTVEDFAEVKKILDAVVKP